jgi:membrane-bound lytic murein transglycosylase D
MHKILLLALAQLSNGSPPAAPAQAQASVPTAPVTRTDAPQAAPTSTPKADEPNESDESELEAMRAMEEAAIDEDARPEVELRVTIEQLGYGSLMRDSLEHALESLELSGDEFSFELPRVTDVATFDVSKVKDRYDIPVEMQSLVAQYIRFFQGGGRKWFRRWMSRSYRYIPLMQPLLEAKGMPRDTVYLAMIESGFSTQARSWAKAVGPWQFIAETGKTFKLKQDFWVDERKDPIKATLAAADFLTSLHSKFGHWYLAWAGYNTGGGRVSRLISTYGTSDFWVLSEKKRKGFARETKHYVPKLIACALVAKHPEAFGFSTAEFDPEPPFEYDVVQVVGALDLEVLAEAAGMTVEALRDLNPELNRDCTPPTEESAPYPLRIAKGRQASFAERYEKLPASERLTFKFHRVHRGDTLSKIANRYHSAPELIVRMNALPAARSLKLTTELAIPVLSEGVTADGAMTPAVAAAASLSHHVARARRAGFSVARPEFEIPAGTVTPKRTKSGAGTATAGSFSVAAVQGKNRVQYAVAQGDSLWSIARRFDVHVEDLRRWNTGLGRAQGLRVGAAVIVWPGAGANLAGVGTPVVRHP